MRLALCLAAAAVALPLTAFASPITYTVDIAYGNVSATGTVTTDGTQGSGFAFTAYNLTLIDGATTDTFNQTTGTLSYAGFPGVISADATGISFDFYGPSTYLIFQDATTGATICFNNQGCDTNGDNVFIQTPSADPIGSGETLAGHQYIALAPAATPEPSSFLLLGTGILGVLATARRRLRS